MSNETPPAIAHNESEHRFEVQLPEGLAILEYSLQGSKIRFLHTEVPDAAGGHGVGTQLAHEGLEYARARGLQVLPICPFVAAHIRRHPEYLDLVPQPYRARLETDPAGASSDRV